MPQRFQYAHDVLSECEKDGLSTAQAVGLSSRFPFLTPPAMVLDKNQDVWGHVVDGGYFENVGITTVMDVYEVLRESIKKNEYPVKLVILLIQNTNDVQPKPILGLHEISVPLRTVTNVWVNNGKFNTAHIGRFALENGDFIESIRLDRRPDDGIPLGWYLSDEAADYIDGQVEVKMNQIDRMMIDLGLPGPHLASNSEIRSNPVGVH